MRPKQALDFMNLNSAFCDVQKRALARASGYGFFFFFLLVRSKVKTTAFQAVRFIYDFLTYDIALN